MAKRRARMEQKCVDLAIALESLLTPVRNGPVEQIALAVRTRGAWLLGANYEERRKLDDLISKLYVARSHIVHGRRIRGGQIKLGRNRHVRLQHIVPDATRLCERAVNHMIEAPRGPDWTAIVLGQDGDRND